MLIGIEKRAMGDIGERMITGIARQLTHLHRVALLKPTILGAEDADIGPPPKRSSCTGRGAGRDSAPVCL